MRMAIRVMAAGSLVATVLLAGCFRRICQEIEVEVVAAYVKENGTWATCVKREDGVRVQFNGRLGAAGEKFPAGYCPEKDGGTYILTPR